MFDAMSFLRDNHVSATTTTTVQGCRVKLTGVPETYLRKDVAKLASVQDPIDPKTGKGGVTVTAPKMNLETGEAADKGVDTVSTTRFVLKPETASSFILQKPAAKAAATKARTKAEERATADASAALNGATVS